MLPFALDYHDRKNVRRCFRFSKVPSLDKGAPENCFWRIRDLSIGIYFLQICWPSTCNVTQSASHHGLFPNNFLNVS